MFGLALVFALLVSAALLVILDLVLLAKREWHKARIREAFQTRLRADLARDSLIHDVKREGKQLILQLKEEADDYLELMALRDAQQTHYHRVGHGTVTSRAVASAQTGNFDTRAYQ